MKKVLALLLITSILFAFCACESVGVSVPYYLMHAANSFDRIFEEHTDITAFCETLSYGDFTYSVYCERAENERFYGYNFVESLPSFETANQVGCLYITSNAEPYTLFAKEGELFVKQAGKTYSIIQLDGLYSDFIKPYETTEHPLDAGEHFQVSSSKEGEMTVVLYKAEITPKMEASLSEYGAVLGEYVFSRFTIGADGLARSIIYSLGTEEGEAVLIRTFEYYSERVPGKFADIPSMDKTVTVTVDYTDRKDSFAVPYGCYLGFDMSTVSVLLFTDKARTLFFDREETAVTENLTLYAGIKP